MGQETGVPPGKGMGPEVGKVPETGVPPTRCGLTKWKHYLTLYYVRGRQKTLLIFAHNGVETVCNANLWICRRNFLPKILYLPQSRIEDGVKGVFEFELNVALQIETFQGKLTLWIWVSKYCPSPNSWRAFCWKCGNYAIYRKVTFSFFACWRTAEVVRDIHSIIVNIIDSIDTNLQTKH